MCPPALDRRLTLAASVAIHRWRQDPVGTTVRVVTLAARRAPRRFVDALTVLTGPFPAAQAVAAQLAGRPDRLAHLADTVARRGRDVDVVRLAGVLVGLDRPTTADHLLSARPVSGHRAQLVAARSAWARGDWTAALALAEEVPTRQARRVAAVWRSLLTPPVPSPPRATRPPAGVTRPPRGTTHRDGAADDDGLDVLHLVTNSLPWTQAGYTVRTHEIVTAQLAAGLRAEVLTRLGFPIASGHLTAAERDEVGAVTYHRALPAWLAGVVGSAPWHAQAVDVTERAVRRLRPRVLHAATDHLNGEVALAVRERTGVPVVYEVRGFLEDSWASRRDGPADGPDPHDTDRYRVARDRETRCMRAADLVVTLGEEMRAEIAGRGVDPARILVVPNAVDERFLRPVTAGPACRGQWGLGDDEVVVGTVSTFYPHEGLDVLLHALAALRAAGAPVRGLLVGDGPEAGRLRSLADRLGLGGQVVFTGRVPMAAAPAYHAALDIFAVPRRRARVTELVTPLKPVEALAIGRPLVVSDVAPLARLVNESGGGLVARAGDAASLAEAIGALCYAPERRAQMGRTGHAYVAAQLTWAAMARRYQAAYAGLVANRESR